MQRGPGGPLNHSVCVAMSLAHVPVAWPTWFIRATIVRGVPPTQTSAREESPLFHELAHFYLQVYKCFGGRKKIHPDS